MSIKPRRTIEEVFFDNLGPLTARDLLTLPSEVWHDLRARLTDKKNGKDGLVARCIACHGQVFIKTSKGRPFFHHYQGSDPGCPWYCGKNMRPNDARALQYQGKQESEMHRRMCEVIAELAALDARCKDPKVDKYLPPTESKHGRYPDVLFDWRGLGRVAVEYQMSHTFQTEVSQRCIHYDRENIQLLWVLSSFDPNHVPQAVKDVVHRHRGNAFVLDQQAIVASREQQTLVLNCHMSNGEGYDAPVLVRFDALTFPETHLPFLEDRLVESLLRQIKKKRQPYYYALRDWGDRSDDLPLAELTPFKDRRRIDLLVAAAFSIVSEAARKPKNFASNHANLRGMMNGYLAPGPLDPFARLLTTLIENTSQRDLLQGKVGEHLERSISSHKLGNVEQVGEQSPEWILLRDLFPEALNPFIRNQLILSRSLPAWAAPPRT